MSPKRGRSVHVAMMVFWGSQMVAVAVLTLPWDWRTYLLELSLYANFVGHWSGWSAERPSEVAA